MSSDVTTVSDDAVAEMVADLRSTWTVESIERVPEGTDFVAVVSASTPEGPREAVLKATTREFVPPVIARAEPRLLELVGRETAIPVASVLGFRDDHSEHPAPFYLLERVEGENFEGRAHELSAAARRRVVADAGRNLARLHDLGPLPAAGHIGVRDGELTVLDTDEHPRYGDFREKVLADAEETLDALADGGWFPDLADDPHRFTDVVPEVRAYLREVVPAMPEPAAPTYCHWDYRYGNLLVDPETGRTEAVLDWANLSAADPAYNLAEVESHLFARAGAGSIGPAPESSPPAAELRATFRRAYADTREDWTFDAAVRERMRIYRLVHRLDAMACLPLWHEDAAPGERDALAADHRAFVRESLDDG